MNLVKLDPQTVPLNAVPVTGLLRIRQLEPQVADLVVPLIKCALLLETDAVHDLIVSLLSLLTFGLYPLLKSLDLSEVLGFFEKDLVAFLIRLLDLLFGFLCQKLY